MKKKFLAKTLALVSLVTLSTHAHTHTGIYVGAALGGSALTGKTDLFVNRILNGGVNPLPQSFNTTISDKNIGGDIFLGYGKRMNCAWIAGEIIASLSSLHARQAFDITATNSQQPLSIRTNHAWGAAINLGYHLHTTTKLYVKLGIETRRFKVNFNATNNLGDPLSSLNKNYHSTAFVPGLGIETELNHRFSLRAEYRTALHSKKTVSVSGVNPITTSVKTNPTIHYFNLGLTFKI